MLGTHDERTDAHRESTRPLGFLGFYWRMISWATILSLLLVPLSAWFLWRTIYLGKLPGWGRRAKVAASWTFDLFLPPELVQLRLGTSGAPPMSASSRDRTSFSKAT